MTSGLWYNCILHRPTSCPSALAKGDCIVISLGDVSQLSLLTVLSVAGVYLLVHNCEQMSVTFDECMHIGQLHYQLLRNP